MGDDEAVQLRVPHPAGRAGKEFTQGVAEHVQRIVEANMVRFVPPENVLRFRHGDKWSIGRADRSTDDGKFESVEVLQSVRHEDFVANDLAKLLEIVEGFTGGLIEGNEKLVVEKTMAAAESVGNEVSASEAGSWPEAFLASLEMIKLTADKHGNVKKPQIVTHPDTAQEMVAELESQGPEFQSRVEAVLNRKVEEARREWNDRLSNYKDFGGPT